jgi:hypothetical protein
METLIRRTSLLLVLSAAVPFVSGCPVGGAKVESPLNGQFRYTCCNIRYEKSEITDVNYQQGAIIPFGTRVQIIEVKKNAVKFLPVGHPEITLVYRHGRKVYPFEQYLDRIFLVDQPTLAASAPASTSKSKKKAAPPAAAKFERQIREGQVEPGMTKAEVLMALGYPPAHRTPSLESPIWTYWRNRWDVFMVYFDGDKVDRLGR